MSKNRQPTNQTEDMQLDNNGEQVAQENPQNSKINDEYYLNDKFFILNQGDKKVLYIIADTMIKSLTIDNTSTMEFITPKHDVVDIDAVIDKNLVIRDDIVIVKNKFHQSTIYTRYDDNTFKEGIQNFQKKAFNIVLKDDVSKEEIIKRKIVNIVENAVDKIIDTLYIPTYDETVSYLRNGDIQGRMNAIFKILSIEQKLSEENLIQKDEQYKIEMSALGRAFFAIGKEIWNLKKEKDKFKLDEILNGLDKNRLLKQQEEMGKDLSMEQSRAIEQKIRKIEEERGRAIKEIEDCEARINGELICLEKGIYTKVTKEPLIAKELKKSGDKQTWKRFVRYAKFLTKEEHAGKKMGGSLDWYVFTPDFTKKVVNQGPTEEGKEKNEISYRLQDLDSLLRIEGKYFYNKALEMNKFYPIITCYENLNQPRFSDLVDGFYEIKENTDITKSKLDELEEGAYRIAIEEPDVLKEVKKLGNKQIIDKVNKYRRTFAYEKIVNGAKGALSHRKDDKEVNIEPPKL